MKIALCVVIIVGMFGLMSCDSPQREAVQQVAFDTKIPPNPKEVLRYLFRHNNVPMTVHESCFGAGTTMDDRTIGDYLSGFLAEHANPDGKNWLEFTTTAVSTANGKSAWECRLMVRRKNEEDEMGWGVAFVVTAADRVVVRESFRCLGGG